MTPGKILVTGAAGFIGYHVSEALIRRGDAVVGADNLNDYYDVTLKQARLARLSERKGFAFNQVDISDKDGIERLFAEHPDITGVIHLAAQAGVRYSLVNPYAYIQANVLGHTTLLDCARHKLKDLVHFVYASSSSVYGGNKDLPFSVEDRVDNPISLYAATKKSCELISHCYAHLYRIPRPACGSLRSTVHGVGRTWPRSSSRARSWPANRSKSSTRATCAETSPSSTTSSQA